MKPKVIAAATLALLLISARSVAAQPSPEPASAPAPSERKLEMAREVIGATGIDAMMVSAFRNMTAQMTASQGAGLSPERQARLKIVSDAEGDALAKMVPRFMQIMVTRYADTFSEQELSDMLAFYRSPSGRSMVAKTPLFMQGVVTDMAGLMPQLKRDMGTEICAKTQCGPAERAAFFGPEPAGAGVAKRNTP